ncbi:MAG TPA: hypothetical protein DDZ80_00530 [Cyanobacteria bacterium UBA8803]|nr:hypothetical protein [Cyanobacteria bacterium UBA9273]HBL57100.1 hypothetical protein [Cyanobacteria bacterium UBA8803]
MDEHEISINRIALHSRGIPLPTVHAAVDGLGQEVMSSLVQQGLVQPGQTIQLGDLNLETLSWQRGGNANELRREIARVLTQAIAARLRRK